MWELSGIPIGDIKRKHLDCEYSELSTFEIRVAVIDSGENKPTLVLCHDYMTAGCIQWFKYVQALSKYFKLIIPDMGTYGANSRIYKYKDFPQ